MADPSTRALESRLRLAMEQIAELREICSVPSISVGILHRGEVILMESCGLRDVEERLPADPDTLYLLGSLSKGFLSATVGVAVAEGKLNWKTPLSHYIPEFKPSDPLLKEKGNLVDCLRHSTGISSPQLLVLGPNGTLIHQEADFVQLINTCPTHDHQGSRYNRWWSYNNWGYGLAAIALERVYQQPYSNILRARVLDPLNLTRTITRGSDLGKDTNVAYPYAQLDNGTFHRLGSDAWTYHEHVAANAVMGMRSCVRDMLTWASNILGSEKMELSNMDAPGSPKKRHLALPNIHQTRKGRWTRPSSGELSLNDNTVYCMGWYKTTIPSPMLGFLSYNDMTREDPESMGLGSIIGVESPEKELIAHNGVFCGSTAAFYTFPDTQSAIITFANGLQDADAAEFAAQIITQALFNLQPKVNILALARRESSLRQRHFTDFLLSDWERQRDTTVLESPRQQYVGTFQGHATKLDVSQDSKTAELCVRFNGVQESTLALRHYGNDAYSYFPATRDEWLLKSMFEWNNHRLALLKFERDEIGDVIGLSWQWDHEGELSWFQKLTKITCQKSNNAPP